MFLPSEPGHPSGRLVSGKAVATNQAWLQLLRIVLKTRAFGYVRTVSLTESEVQAVSLRKDFSVRLVRRKRVSPGPAGIAGSRKTAPMHPGHLKSETKLEINALIEPEAVSDCPDNTLPQSSGTRRRSYDVGAACRADILPELAARSAAVSVHAAGAA
jgi:hypothetical protein